MAVISACAVGSLVAVTWFVPNATTARSLTSHRTEMGLQSPLSTFSVASLIAILINCDSHLACPDYGTTIRHGMLYPQYVLGDPLTRLSLLNYAPDKFTVMSIQSLNPATGEILRSFQPLGRRGAKGQDRHR